MTKIINKYLIRAIAAILMAIILNSPAFAMPTFQTYVSPSLAGTIGNDEDTWFTSSDPFNLFVVGAFGPNTQSLTQVTLLVSVPQGENGTLSITSVEQPEDISPVLLTSMGLDNPTANSDSDILTNVAGKDGYSIKNFFPTGYVINNHYPVQDGVSDFLIYNLGSFVKEDVVLSNYDADSGTITSLTKSSPWGEQKQYLVSYTGFSRLHFDVYGLDTEEHGRNTDAEWVNNPGSHDSTAGGGSEVIPEPASMALLSLGLAGLVRLRRNK